MGVVAVETRTVELSIPADPANLDSEAKVGPLRYIVHLYSELLCAWSFFFFFLICWECCEPPVLEGGTLAPFHDF